MNAYTGDIILFAGFLTLEDAAIKGYAICDGRLLQIAQYGALFKVLGTTYGGDGQTTFALPDLRGRVPLGAGNAVKLGDSASATGGSIGEPVQIFNPKDPRSGTGATVTVWQSDGAASAAEPPYTAINYMICLEGADPASS